MIYVYRHRAIHSNSQIHVLFVTGDERNDRPVNTPRLLAPRTFSNRSTVSVQHRSFVSPLSLYFSIRVIFFLCPGFIVFFPVIHFSLSLSLFCVFIFIFIFFFFDFNRALPLGKRNFVCDAVRNGEIYSGSLETVHARAVASFSGRRRMPTGRKSSHLTINRIIGAYYDVLEPVRKSSRSRPGEDALVNTPMLSPSERRVLYLCAWYSRESKREKKRETPRYVWPVTRPRTDSTDACCTHTGPLFAEPWA